MIEPAVNGSVVRCTALHCWLLSKAREAACNRMACRSARSAASIVRRAQSARLRRRLRIEIAHLRQEHPIFQVRPVNAQVQQALAACCQMQRCDALIYAGCIILAHLLHAAGRLRLL